MYGTEKNFENIWQKCSDELYRFFLHSVHEPADAADLLHDVALQGIEHWSMLRDSSAARAWLFKIARNKVRDFYKK